MRNALLGRPLLLFVLLFLLGEAIIFFFSIGPIFYLFIVLSSLILTIIIWRYRLSLLFLLLLVALPLGGYMAFSSMEVPSEPLQAKRVWGEVISEPKEEEYGSFFFLQVRAKEEENKEPVRLRVYVSTPEGNSLKRGDFLELKGNPGTPQGDFATYLKKEGCFYTFRAYKVTTLRSTITPLGSFIADLRDSLEGMIEQAVKPPASQILTGIIIGRATQIDPLSSRPFEEIGTAHILAASGTNIALLLAFVIAIFKLFHLPRRWALITSIPLILFYATLCGWLPSISRAVIMSLLGILSLLVSREKDFLTTLATACFAVLLVDPLALFALDFQLSFLATACLFAFLPEFHGWLPKRIPPWLKTSLLSTLACFIGISPLIASSFHILPLVAPLANLVSLPVVSLLLPFSLLSLIFNFFLPQIGHYLLWAAGEITGFFYQFSEGLSSLPLAYLIVPDAPQWLSTLYWIILAGCLALIGLSLKRKHKRIAVIITLTFFVLFISWISIFPAIWPPQFLEIHFLDVGQGDSILIRTPQRVNLLWDGGKGKMCLSELKELGINKLDLVFLSHPHSDHLNGLYPVIEAIKPSLIVFGPQEDSETEKFESFLEEEGIPYHQVSEGFSLKVGQAQINVLAPPDYVSDWSTNDLSLVCSFSFGNLTCLLPGDIEEKGRDNLRDKEIDSDILKVPHHGSATALDLDFLKRVSPDAAIISVGKNNYGQPAQETLDLLEQENIPTYLTSNEGTITIFSDGETIKIKTVR